MLKSNFDRRENSKDYLELVAFPSEPAAPPCSVLLPIIESLTCKQLVATDVSADIHFLVSLLNVNFTPSALDRPSQEPFVVHS